MLFCIFIYVLLFSPGHVASTLKANALKSMFTDAPSFPLFNAAEDGLHLPALGIGTGYYSMKNEPYGVYPECGAEPHGNPPVPPPPGCGFNTQKSVYTWLKKAGGVRLDCANSYYNQRSIAQAIKQSLVNRSQIFILSKVGAPFPLGYVDTLEQTLNNLRELQTDWIDLLLIHWPYMTNGTKSSDPFCNMSNLITFNETQCRLSTWAAMLVLLNSGVVRSVGVSNYNTTHIQEIIDAGMPLPSVNQVSFNPYNYRTGRADLLAFCQKHNIQLVGYSTLGTLDAHQYPVEHPSVGKTGLSRTLLEDPVITSLAETYNRTPAQILLRWSYQLGVPSNPRSMNESHMIENLEILSKPFTINDTDMIRIANMAQDTCDIDPDWYQCVGNGNLP